MFWKRETPSFVVVYPWVAWSEGNTERAVKTIRNTFGKEPPSLDASEAEVALELLEAAHGGENKIPLEMVLDRRVGRSMLKDGTASHDEHERDMFGRKRYPEIVREIGFSPHVIEELGIDFRSKR